jgi:hypothetical protein
VHASGAWQPASILTFSPPRSNRFFWLSRLRSELRYFNEVVQARGELDEPSWCACHGLFQLIRFDASQNLFDQLQGLYISVFLCYFIRKPPTEDSSKSFATEPPKASEGLPVFLVTVLDRCWDFVDLSTEERIECWYTTVEHTARFLAAVLKQYPNPSFLAQDVWWEHISDITYTLAKSLPDAPSTPPDSVKDQSFVFRAVDSVGSLLPLIGQVVREAVHESEFYLSTTTISRLAEFISSCRTFCCIKGSPPPGLYTDVMRVIVADLNNLDNNIEGWSKSDTYLNTCFSLIRLDIPGVVDACSAKELFTALQHTYEINHTSARGIIRFLNPYLDHLLTKSRGSHPSLNRHLDDLLPYLPWLCIWLIDNARLFHAKDLHDPSYEQALFPCESFVQIIARARPRDQIWDQVFKALLSRRGIWSRDCQWRARLFVSRLKAVIQEELSEPKDVYHPDSLIAPQFTIDRSNTPLNVSQIQDSGYSPGNAVLKVSLWERLRRAFSMKSTTSHPSQEPNSESSHSPETPRKADATSVRQSMKADVVIEMERIEDPA